MNEVSTIGLDIAKNVFQAHGALLHNSMRIHVGNPVC